MEQVFKWNTHLNRQKHLLCNAEEPHLLITVISKMATRMMSTFEMESTIRGYHVQKKHQSFGESESLPFSAATANHVVHHAQAFIRSKGAYLG